MNYLNRVRSWLFPTLIMTLMVAFTSYGAVILSWWSGVNDLGLLIVIGLLSPIIAISVGMGFYGEYPND